MDLSHSLPHEGQAENFFFVMSCDGRRYVGRYSWQSRVERRDFNFYGDINLSTSHELPISHLPSPSPLPPCTSLSPHSPNCPPLSGKVEECGGSFGIGDMGVAIGIDTGRSTEGDIDRMTAFHSKFKSTFS